MRKNDISSDSLVQELQKDNSDVQNVQQCYLSLEMQEMWSEDRLEAKKMIMNDKDKDERIKKIVEKLAKQDKLPEDLYKLMIILNPIVERLSIVCEKNNYHFNLRITRNGIDMGLGEYTKKYKNYWKKRRISKQLG